MKHETRVIAAFAILSSSFIIPHSSFAAAKADALVLDPYRAVGQTWRKHPVKGKDFWMFLSTRWRQLPGVAEERFVQESGVEVMTGLSPMILNFYRTISIRDLKAYDAAGAEVPVRATLTCDEPDAVCWTSDNGSLVVSCDILDPARKFLAAVGAFKVTAEKPFVKLTFAHGDRQGSQVDAIVNVGAKAETVLGKDTGAIELETPAQALSCELKSKPWRVRYTGLNEDDKLAAILATHPFIVNTRLNSWPVMNSPEGSVDFSGIRRIDSTYPDTFVGMKSYEWDANYLQQITHGPTGDLLADMRFEAKIPCGRLEMADNMYRNWRNQERAAGRDKLFGMSGCINFMQYAADFGAKVVSYEITEGIGGQTRIQNMLTFSAARQFGIESALYMAYFGDNQTADSSYNPAVTVNGGRRTDFGTSPNYSLRCYYLGYYMGNNYLEFESQTSGQTIDVKGADGKIHYELTGNGKAIKDIWEWSEKPEGARGEWYAPILLLKDRASISDGKFPLSNRPFAFYELFPATDGDAYVDMVDQLISPYENRRGWTDPSGGTDLVNSEFADIFSSYIANPLMHGEVTYKDLAKYPVIFVLGDMNWTETLANTVKSYVLGGGTLVLTAAQAEPFGANFTGYKTEPGTVNSKDGLVIRKGKVTNPRSVIRKTSDDLPLVIKTDYLKGRVLYVTSPNFRRANKKDFAKPPKELKELLLAVQDEVVPFKVRGNCEALYNRLPDGSWKLLLVNNNGFAKATNETEEHYFPEYTYDITLTLPKGAVAKEVRLGLEGKVSENEELGIMNDELRKKDPSFLIPHSTFNITYKLPPAGILVVDVGDAVSHRVTQDETSSSATRRDSASPEKRSSAFSFLKSNFSLNTPPAFDPVRNFVKRTRPSGVKNDGFRFDPETRLPKTKAPELVGEWLAKNHFKDSSGNGRDLEVVGPIAFKDGVATFAGDKPTFARKNYAGFPETLYEGTIETWVKPDLTAKPYRGDPKRGATYGVFSIYRDIMVSAQRGRWSLSMTGGFQREDVFGPEVKPEWTHLAVAFKNGVYNLYVNGVQVKDVNGPMRGGRQGKDSFYDVLTVWYGSTDPNWGYYFRGDMMGLRYLSRRLSDDEIKAHAAKRWE